MIFPQPMNYTETEMNYMAKVAVATVEWAFNGSYKGPLMVTSGFGTWRALAESAAVFIGDHEHRDIMYSLMETVAKKTYGPHWYGILWAYNDYSRLDVPHRDAKGVYMYLRRLQKNGII